jgi:cyclopropane-fatty-acyl-phospholipid synthase
MGWRNSILTSMSREHWSDKSDGGHRHSTEEWLERYASELLAMLPQGGAVLDVGCGACQLTTYLAPRFAWVYAVDSSQSMLAAAHQRIQSREINNIELLHGTAQAFPRKIGRVDVVLSCGVIQYLTLSDFDVHLRECQTLLDGSGIVCVANIPNAAAKGSYYRTVMIPAAAQHLAARLRRELRILRSWVNGYRKKDPFWDRIGNWFSRTQIEAAAERFGFNCELRDSLYYDYRFHALLSPK